MHPDVQMLHDELAYVLKREDDALLRAHLEPLKAADVAELMELLEDIDRSRVLFALDGRAAAEVITCLDERVRDDVVDELTEDRLAEMITALPADDAADVLGELSEEESGKLLEKLPEARSEQIEKLLEYEEGTAGSLLNPDVVFVPARSTVGEAIRYLRRANVRDDVVLQIYTTDDQGRLSGTVSPQRLLVAREDRPLAEILEPDPISVTVEEDREDVVNLFRKYDLTSLPVVTEQGRLVGQITVDDVLDAAADEADEDMYHMAGTDAAELGTSSTVRAAWIRFRWLLPSFLFLSGTATIIFLSTGFFGTALHGALICFVPMIAALAGCCSVQSSTVIIRGLATGDLASSKLSLALLRDGRIALIMAPLCAVVAWCLVFCALPVLGRMGQLDEGVAARTVANAVGLGMLGAVLVASLLGILLPFAFRRLGIDPAISAGPLITAANDFLCVSLYMILSLCVVSLG